MKRSTGHGLVLTMDALKVLSGSPISDPSQATTTTTGDYRSGDICVEIKF
jgi:hypothetical protein